MVAKRHLTPNSSRRFDEKGRPRTHEARATSRVDLGGEEHYFFVGSHLFGIVTIWEEMQQSVYPFCILNCCGYVT